MKTICTPPNHSLRRGPLRRRNFSTQSRRSARTMDTSSMMIVSISL